LAVRCSFHETPQDLHFTISQEARWEVLDRLLALNHERYVEEVKAGFRKEKEKKNTNSAYMHCLTSTDRVS
jgi:hypothetical protein